MRPRVLSIEALLVKPDGKASISLVSQPCSLCELQASERQWFTKQGKQIAFERTLKVGP